MKEERIIIYHIGTSKVEALVKELNVLVEEVKVATGKDVVLAFSSKKAIDTLRQEQIEIGFIDDEIHKAAETHCAITIMPLHLVGGGDYQRVKKLVEQMKYERGADKRSQNIRLLRPILSDCDNRKKLADVIHTSIKKCDDHVLFVGHGTSDGSIQHYDEFNQSYRELGRQSSFMTLRTPVEEVLRNIPDTIALVPLFTVSGCHVERDLFEGEQSIYRKLTQAGKEVAPYKESLLAQKDIREIYIHALGIQ